MLKNPILLIIALVLPLVACSFFGLPPEQQQPSIEDLPDLQLFPLEDCSSGCWNGLQPGETAEDRVLQLLDNPPFHVFQISTEYENYSIIFANHEDGYSVVAVSTQEHLQRLEISSRWLGLTLGEVIASLGESSYVSVAHDTGGEVFVLNTALTLYYPTQGFVFHLLESDGLSGELTQNGEVEVCISENALVSSVEITQAGSINDMLEEINSPAQRSTIITPDQLGEWLGFGCVLFPYP